MGCAGTLGAAVERVLRTNTVEAECVRLSW